jgi:hypothetical protein
MLIFLQLQCGNDQGLDSYPLIYGEKNCLAFQNNINQFSAQGQAWIWDTMFCLQTFLSTNIHCDSTCSSTSTAAFNSHPTCYVQSGFCDLPVWDYYHVFTTVGTQLFKGPAWAQVKAVNSQCWPTMLARANNEVQALIQDGFDNPLHIPQNTILISMLGWVELTIVALSKL